MRAVLPEWVGALHDKSQHALHAAQRPLHQITNMHTKTYQQTCTYKYAQFLICSCACARLRCACCASHGVRAASRGGRGTSHGNNNNSIITFAASKSRPLKNYDNYNTNNYHSIKDEISYNNYKISEYLIISIRMMHDQRFRENLIIFIRYRNIL